MTEKNGRCDICYRKLPGMPPEMRALAERQSKERGDWVEDPAKRVTVCDPCWQRAIRRGWRPGHCFECKQKLPYHKMDCSEGRRG